RRNHALGQGMLDEFDADRARAAHQHARHMRPRLDLEIAPLARRLEIRIGGRGAPAVADRVLAAAEPPRAGAVVVGGIWHAGGLGGVDPGVVGRIARLPPWGAERPRTAAIFVLALLPALRPLEIRQHVRIGPAARALLRPSVVVAAMAARIG